MLAYPDYRAAAVEVDGVVRAPAGHRSVLDVLGAEPARAPDGTFIDGSVLDDCEVVIVCNPNTGAPVSVDVLVDHTLNPEHATYRVLYSSSAHPAPPGPAASRGVLDRALTRG